MWQQTKNNVIYKGNQNQVSLKTFPLETNSSGHLNNLCRALSSNIRDLLRYLQCAKATERYYQINKNLDNIPHA